MQKSIDLSSERESVGRRRQLIRSLALRSIRCNLIIDSSRRFHIFGFRGILHPLSTGTTVMCSGRWVWLQSADTWPKQTGGGNVCQEFRRIEQKNQSGDRNERNARKRKAILCQMAHTRTTSDERLRDTCKRSHSRRLPRTKTKRITKEIPKQ